MYPRAAHRGDFASLPFYFLCEVSRLKSALPGSFIAPDERARAATRFQAPWSSGARIFPLPFQNNRLLNTNSLSVRSWGLRGWRYAALPLLLALLRASRRQGQNLHSVRSLLDAPKSQERVAVLRTARVAFSTVP